MHCCAHKKVGSFPTHAPPKTPKPVSLKQSKFGRWGHAGVRANADVRDPSRRDSQPHSRGQDAQPEPTEHAWTESQDTWSGYRLRTRVGRGNGAEPGGTHRETYCLLWLPGGKLTIMKHPARVCEHRPVHTRIWGRNPHWPWWLCNVSTWLGCTVCPEFPASGLWWEWEMRDSGGRSGGWKGSSSHSASHTSSLFCWLASMAWGTAGPAAAPRCSEPSISFSHSCTRCVLSFTTKGPCHRDQRWQQWTWASVCPHGLLFLHTVHKDMCRNYPVWQAWKRNIWINGKERATSWRYTLKFYKWLCLKCLQTTYKSGPCSQSHRWGSAK